MEKEKTEEAIDKPIEKPVVIVLGGTVPHIELLKKLDHKGYHTVLIDYYQDPPAKAFAHEHICESTLDQEAVLRITKEKKGVMVMGPCVDQANVVACYVSEQLGLPEPYNYETSLDVTDKGRMKEIMKANGIPTSDFVVVETSDEAAKLESISYPAVVKPVDNNGSKGVRKVDCKEEMVEAVAHGLSLSRAGRAIVEGYCPGSEIQVDCFVKDNEAHVIMSRHRLKTKPETGRAIQAFGSLIPAVLTEKVRHQVEEAAVTIAKAFKLNNTPFFYQGIVTEERLSVLELAPRIGGNLSYFFMKEAAKFDILDATIAAFEGKSIVMDYQSPKSLYASSIIYAKAGILRGITGFDDMKDQGLVLDYYFMKTPGMEIGTEMDSRNRVACYFMKGESYKDLLDKARIIQDAVGVTDNQGKDIMCRDLIMTEDMIPGGIG